MPSSFAIPGALFSPLSSSLALQPLIERPSITIRSQKDLSTYINTLNSLRVDNLHYKDDGIPCTWLHSLDICKAQGFTKFSTRISVNNSRVLKAYKAYDDSERASFKSKLYNFAPKWKRFRNS